MRNTIKDIIQISRQTANLTHPLPPLLFAVGAEGDGDGLAFAVCHPWGPRPLARQWLGPGEAGLSEVTCGQHHHLAGQHKGGRDTVMHCDYLICSIYAL